MYEGYVRLLVKKQDRILLIKFNNIAKKNCLSPETYMEIGRCLRTVAKDDSIAMVILTGVGDFFTSGNDLTARLSDEDFDVQLRRNNDILKEMLSATIDCPKILVALVNGPAIGIGVTLAGLCDIIWCEENAYFYTPFTKLGLVPEGCSSYLMPLLIGCSKASELLLLSEKMTSSEAYKFNFVSRVFKLADLETIILPKLQQYSQLPSSSMQTSKALIRLHNKEALYKALNAECDELWNRFHNEEFINAVLAFAKRKEVSKL